MASSPQLSRLSLAEQVTEALVEFIMSEGLAEGDSLPSTAGLSEHFGVSRTVIREALAALAGRGVVSRSQGRECLVAQPGADDLMRLFRFRMDSDDTSLRHILDVRVALEALAARLAASNATEQDLLQLRERLGELAAAKTDAAYHRADIALHRAVAVASANPMLVLILDSLVDLLRKLRVTATKARRARGESLDLIIKQHERVVAAIESGDPEQAAATMLEHLDSARSELP